MRFAGAYLLACLAAGLVGYAAIELGVTIPVTGEAQAASLLRGE